LDPERRGGGRPDPLSRSPRTPAAAAGWPPPVTPVTPPRRARCQIHSGGASGPTRLDRFRGTGASLQASLAS
jgi:hypothetical protein